MEGNGCVSHHQEPYTRKKRPDGSDGGEGARVVIVSDSRLSTLDNVPVTAIGPSGTAGRGKSMTGKKVRTMPPPDAHTCARANTHARAYYVCAELQLHVASIEHVLPKREFKHLPTSPCTHAPTHAPHRLKTKWSECLLAH